MVSRSLSALWLALAGASSLCAACTIGDSGKASAAELPAPAQGRVAEPASRPVAASSSPASRIDITPDLERSCRRICDRSQQLRCDHASDCLPNCIAMGSATPCTDEMLGFFRCLVDQPLNRWECAPDGVAAIKAGTCDPEQARTATCMEAKMRGHQAR